MGVLRFVPQLKVKAATTTTKTIRKQTRFIHSKRKLQNNQFKQQIIWFSKFLFHSKARLCPMLKFERKETVKGFVKAEDFRNNNHLKVQDFKNIYSMTIL